MAEKAEIVLSAVDRTRPAFASAQKGLQQLQASTAAIAVRLGAIGASVAVAAQALDLFNPKPVIDAADALNKLSQRTGIATEALSAYDYAAKLADISTEELGDSLKKLNLNIAAAARGEKEQAAAFSAIGVAVTDASGKVRSADAVFADIADRFQTYNDGANKVAIANAVGGRSFEKLIPLLNGGSAGLRDARKELEAFGGLISSDLARKSEQFNDNLTKLSVAANALKVSLAGGLIDNLVEMSNRMVEGAKSGNLFAAALENAGRFALPKFAGDAIFDKALPADKLKESQKQIDDLTSQVVRLQNYLAANPNSSGTQKAIDAITAKIEVAKKAQSDAQRLVSDRFLRSEKAGSDFSAAPPAKRDAPALSVSGAASRAEAVLRQQLSNRIKALEDALGDERDALAFQNRYLDQVYDAGLISLDTFYREKTAAAQRALDDELRILDQQIEAQRAFAGDKRVDAKDRERAEGEITEAQRKQAQLRLQFQRDSVLDQQAQEASVKRLNDSYKELIATLAQLSGDTFGAELQRIDQQVDAARRLDVQKNGRDTGRADQLRKLLSDQAALASIREKVTNATTDLAIAEERYGIAADASGTGLREQEEAIYAIRQKSLAQLSALNDQVAKLAANSDSPELKRAAAEIALQFERALASVDPLVQRLNDAAKSLGEGIADSFGRAIVEGGKLSDVLKDIERQILNAVTKLLITDPLAKSIEGAIKGVIGGGSNGGGGFDLFGSIGKLFTSLFHEGGVVGETSSGRSISPLVFAGATRYHSGGLAGLAPDEVPAILRRREEVLTTADPRHRDNGGGGRSITVNVQAQPGMRRETAMQQGRWIAEALAVAQRRNG